jgi:rod shape determining protein RodA
MNGIGGNAAPMSSRSAKRREWRMLRNVDVVLLAAALLLTIVGVVMVTSATSHRPVGGDPYFYTMRQATWALGGLVVMVAFMMVDYINFQRYAHYLYAGMLSLLVLVLVFGRTVLGAQSWLRLGILDFQPSEASKILIILCLGALLGQRTAPIRRWVDFVLPGLYVAIPMLLIIRQPDLGTSLVFAAILIGMLFTSGASAKKLALFAGVSILVVTLAMYLHLVHDVPLPLRRHQVQRLTAFLDPQIDPLGAGYHLRQSLIAIGGGGGWGQGLFSGNQNRLKFLPEQHTDFIFAVIGEELGLAGVVTLLSLYLLIFWRGIHIAIDARDPYGSLLSAGIVSMMAFHVLVNAGMALGVMPITGLPLPFVSYGGNNLMVNFAGIGLLQSIRVRRHVILF